MTLFDQLYSEINLNKWLVTEWKKSNRGEQADNRNDFKC